MATQGLISIVENDKVLWKIVAGCNGYNIDNVIKEIDRENISEICSEKLFDIALNCSFGCIDCLTVFSKEKLKTKDDILFHECFPLYLKTFDDSKFNSRWEYGTAAYNKTIVINRNHIMAIIDNNKEN